MMKRLLPSKQSTHTLPFSLLKKPTPLDADLNGYESSLYTLKVSQTLRVILTVDEDPIFDQVIFTLFRVVNLVDVPMTYQAIAKSLYQEIAHQNQQAVQAS
jgi:Txe/YoeB family toxin of Txe-Axe toxin-antitoxin module